MDLKLLQLLLTVRLTGTILFMILFFSVRYAVARDRDAMTPSSSELAIEMHEARIIYHPEHVGGPNVDRATQTPSISDTYTGSTCIMENGTAASHHSDISSVRTPSIVHLSPRLSRTMRRRRARANAFLIGRETWQTVPSGSMRRTGRWQICQVLRSSRAGGINQNRAIRQYIRDWKRRSQRRRSQGAVTRSPSAIHEGREVWWK
jgi:hypothetical protein